MDAVIRLLPSFLTLWDFATLAVFFGCLFGMTWLIEHSSDARPSTSRLMAGYRHQWMRRMAARPVRVQDAMLLATLRNGAAFFASGAMVATGGIFALLRQTEQLVDVAEEVAGEIGASRVNWEAKLLFLLIVMVIAFLRFVWSHRVFGYCAILIGATPDDGGEVETAAAAERATQLLISAGRSFNRGLRMLYFALAALAWFFGPAAQAVASLLTASMLYRREFLSRSREALLQGWEP